VIDPIYAVASGPLAALEPVPQFSLPLALPTVSGSDQARFQTALHSVAEPATIAPPMAAAIAVAHERGAAAPGDLILHGLERLRGEYRAVGGELDALSKRTDLNPMDLLGIQMQVAQVTLGTQLIGQVASKLEQNLNTLLKSQ
jgi:type III secretion system YscI/HrpB-like protein